MHNILSLGAIIKEGLIVFDRSKKIVFANASACKMLGCEESVLTGVLMDDFLKDYIVNTNEDADTFLATLRNVSEEVSLDIDQSYMLEFTNTPAVLQEVSIGTIGSGADFLGVIVFGGERITKECETYKKMTQGVLAHITPALRKAAVGDFATRIDIPENIDKDLETLIAGTQLMLDDLNDLSMRTLEAHKEQIEVVKVSETSLAQQVQDTSTELQKAKQHIEIIVESLTSGLVEYDGEFCVRRINHAAEMILGVRHEDVVGTRVLPEHKDTKEKEALAVVSYPVLAKNGKRVDGKKLGFDDNATVHEIIIEYPQHRELEVVTLSLIGQDQNHEGFIKVIRDVTKEKEISRSKSDFINIAAHQLRTPLSAVKWVVRMILDGDVGLLNPDQRKLLDKGYEENDKMITMVNDLLNVARIEDDRFGYVFKEANIGDSVTIVVDELRIMAEKGGIDLIFDKPADIESFIFDPEKMQIAVHNLIGNAIKYTQVGGTVRVSLKKEGEYVVVEIQDTGVGIPEKQIDKMFTKFFRAENAVRLQVGGSGLGLFIVKDIVARHGGDITVKSVEGKGTTFTLKIVIKHDDQSQKTSTTTEIKDESR